MVQLFKRAIAIVFVVALTASAAGIHTMLVTRKALKEQPSLEVILSRIGDIYASQEFTQRILFQIPVSADSKWASALGALSAAASDSISKELRSRGAYSDAQRAIIPLTIYVAFGAPILAAADSAGQYPNLVAAVGALTGKDFSPIQDEYKAIREKEGAYLDLAGELSLLQTQYQTTLAPEDKQAIMDQRLKLKVAKKELKGMRKALIRHLGMLLDEAAKSGGDPALQNAVYNALSYAYMLNESAMDGAIVVGIQSVRVIQKIPEEIKTLGPRLIKDGIAGVMDGFKGTADLSAMNPEDLAMAILSQVRLEGGKVKLDSGKLGDLVQSNEKLAALKGLAADQLSQFLSGITGNALEPFTKLIGDATQAPERISKSVELIQFNIGVIDALDRKIVTGGKDLGDAIFEIPMPKIKVEKVAAQMDSGMNKKQRELAEKAAKMSPRNLEMGFVHIGWAYNGLGSSKVSTNRFSGMYGYDETKDILMEAPGMGASMNAIGVQSEKSDFLRDAVFYNLAFVSSAAGGSTPPKAPGDTTKTDFTPGGGEFGMNMAYLKDPFFFLPHVIGSGPATIEWFAGGGLGWDVGIGWSRLQANKPDKDSGKADYRGSITEFRFTWNNSLTGGGAIRLLNGVIMVSATYSWFPKEISLLNLSGSLTDKKSTTTDTNLYKERKFSDYKYEFESKYGTQNLFGATNYFAKTFYEGGNAQYVNVRVDLPFEIKPITRWLQHSGDVSDSIAGIQRPAWQRMFKGTLGLNLGFTRRSNTYSIIKGRDQFGVTPFLANDDREVTYKTYGISAGIDFSINPDYIAIGAR